MKRKVIYLILGLLLAVGIFFAWKSIRDEFFPIPMKPLPGWEPYVNSLDAEYQTLFVDAGGTQLEAALFIPEGGSAKKPAVVFSPGSGDSLFSNYAPDFIETFILEVFLPRDFAVLLVNKRGMGESGGSYVKNSIEGRAEDLYASVQTLQNHPQIDPDHVGVIGHSQGGWVVVHAAAEHPDIAFFISLAGPATTIYEQTVSRNENYARCIGLSGAEYEDYIKKQIRKIELGLKIGEITNFGTLGFDYRTMFYNPREALLQISNPGLFVFGSNDILVTPSVSYERLEEIFDGGLPSNLKTVEIEGANHSFRLVEDMCVFSGGQEDGEQAAQLGEELNDWLAELGY
jgi:pimeloyl-ACP methyl ester carboxylesterase